MKKLIMIISMTISCSLLAPSCGGTENSETDQPEEEHSDGDGHDHGNEGEHSEGDGHDHGNEGGHSEGDGHNH